MLDIYTIQNISKMDERDRQGFPMPSDAENILEIDWGPEHKRRNGEKTFWKLSVGSHMETPDFMVKAKKVIWEWTQQVLRKTSSTICWWQYSNPLVLFLTLLLDFLLWVESFPSGSKGHSDPWLETQRIILPVHRDWLQTYLWSQLMREEDRIMADPVSRHTFSPAKSELWRHSLRFASRHHFPRFLERMPSGEQGNGEVVLVAPSPWNWHILI